MVPIITAPQRHAMLTERRAHATLGNGEPLPHMLDANAPKRGTQKFLKVASFRISLSNVRSVTALHSYVIPPSQGPSIAEPDPT